MNGENKRRRKLVILVMAGIVFLLHFLGLLSVVVLAISGIAGVMAALGLLTELPRVKDWIRDMFDALERRLI